MSGSNTLWELVINKRIGTEEWANVYHLADGGEGGLNAAILAVIDLERSIHGTVVEFTTYVIRPFPGPGEGTSVPIGQFGIAAIVDYLPLFNVARVDFPAPFGRPSRKYYRLPIAEATVSNGVWSGTFYADFTSQLATKFAAIPAGALVDVDGQVLSTPRLAVQVGMRQVRRGSKRKAPTT